ncbi:MAG: GNAT family N-acetyltransferase, partial [Acidimicrobiales bacterium]|nr:GNAT family N-acetyltransferase [Acidimicrobiales bacterium]
GRGLRPAKAMNASAGVASALMEAAVERLDRSGASTIHLGAQAHLADWYARFGFVVGGPSYDEDGILHVPMERHADGNPS